MSQRKEIIVHLTNKDHSPQSGVFVMQEFDNSERMMRALKALLTMWALAGVTLFIPIAHFFLVPGFLLGGPVMAYLKYSKLRVSEYAEGSCPVCGEQTKIHVEVDDYLPVWADCTQCHSPLTIKEQ